jgi:phytanoyl-CoA hydroxylase
MRASDRYEEMRRGFDEDGFVNAGPVLDAAEIDLLRSELERFIDWAFRGRPLTAAIPATEHHARELLLCRDLSNDAALNLFQIGRLWEISAVFSKLVHNPTIAEMAAVLTQSDTIQVWIDTVQYKPPGRGAPFHWHQDAAYHTSIVPSERLIGAWVALDDADEETGCMWMVPGSHRWGLREEHLMSLRPAEELSELVPVCPPPGAPETQKAWRGAVPCRVKAGEVHFHHAFMWHGSRPNRGPRPRRAYSIFYMPAGIRASEVLDARIPVPPGALMTEAAPTFPIVYRRNP